MSSIIGWVYKNGIITLLVVLVFLSIILWVTYRVFGDNPPVIGAGTVSALATVYGLPAIAVGLWKWRTGKDEKS